MALKHDAQGFLVGDPIDLSKAVADWAAIRDDVRAIRQAVLGIESALNRDAPEARASVPATPGRGAGLEEADPTVKAFNEVAQPMARDARQGADTARAPQNPQAVPARQALTGQPAQAARRERQIPVLLRAPAVPQTGGAGGNAARRDTESAAAITRAVAELRATRQAVTPAPAQPMGRDSRGRFVRGAAAARPAAGGGRGAGAGGPTDGERDGQDESALRSLGDRIVGAFKESGAGLEEADPTVKAFNEVAQPMARGYELLTGGDSQKKQEGWLRRIYGSLTGFRKDEGLFNKVAAKRLKAIEEKPVAEAGGGGGLFGGLLGMLGGLLKRIPGVGALAASAGGLLARGGGLLAGAGRMAAGAGRGLLGLGRGALRRIPIIGALLGGIGAATDIYDSETDDTLTRREKDQRAGKAVGGLAGTMGGMFAGAKLGALVGAFAGPVGAAIGGAIGGAAGLFFGDQAGQIIGTTVGGWVSDLRDADIPGKIAAAWTATTEAVMSAWNATVEGVKKGWDSVVSGFTAVGDGIGKAWGKFVDSAKAGWDAITSLFTSAYEGLKSLPVIGPAIESVEGAAKKAAEVVSSAATGAKELASKVADAAVELGSQAIDGVKAGASYLAENTTVGRGATKAWEGAKSISGQIAERWNDAKQYLLGASDKAGVDAGTVAKIANFESGFNADAAPIRRDGTRLSSAHGYGQFIDGTWTDMLNKYGGKYGIEGAGKLTKEQAAKFRGDKTIQAAMLAEFTRENIEKGRKYGGTDDDANVYAFHNLGDKDAKNLLTGMRQNPSMTVREALSQGAKTDKERARVEAVITNNRSLYGDGSVTAAEAYSRMGQVMRRGEVFAADAQQAQQAPGGKRPPSYAALAMAKASPDGEAKPAPPRAAAAPEGVTAPAAPALAQVSAPAAPVGIVAPAAPVVAAVSVPTVPAAPVVPPIADAPPVAVPMAGADARKPVAVVAQPAEVGQDLRERGIAHIATGGLGGA